MYNAIVKTLKPEPSEDPAILGKFELWSVLEKPYIVAKNPLKFDEAVGLIENGRNFEAYAEDIVKITTAQIDKMIENKSIKIRAYSKKLLRFEEHYKDSVVLAELALDRDYIPEKPTLFSAKLKLYIKKVDNIAPQEALHIIRNYTDYIADYMKQKVLLDKDPSVLAEVLKKSDFENERALWLLNVFLEDIELFREICRILKKVRIERSKERMKIYYSNWDEELRIYVNESYYDHFLALEEVAKNA
jgi:hypothetical protein